MVQQALLTTNTTMTKEQLLVPRYKVIARWPNMEDFWLLEGVIIELSEVDDSNIRFAKVGEGHCYSEWFNLYPHLFRCLEWWEDRELNEMPPYIKRKRGDVHKVKGWFKDCDQEMCYNTDDDDLGWNMFTIPSAIPATESEYLAYINQQK